MVGDKAGLWRYRVGDYRLICHIDDEAESLRVLRIAHRKEACR
jgi:mRNA interferase RelE/StbE